MLAVWQQIMNANLPMGFLLEQSEQFLLRRNFSMGEGMVCIWAHSLFVGSLVLDSKTPINPKTIMQNGSLMSTGSQERHV